MHREPKAVLAAARRRTRRRAAGPRPDARRAADRRDRQGLSLNVARPDHGRADRLAVGPRGPAALPDRRRRCARAASPILFISHRMEEVFEIADRVTILRDGRWISTTPRGELTPATRDPGHGRARRRRLLPAHRRHEPGEVVLEVRGPGPRRVPSRVSRSRFARARSSGSPASSARAAPTSGSRCSASRPRTAARSSSTAGRSRIRQPQRRPAARHRLRDRGSPTAGPRLAACRSRPTSRCPSLPRYLSPLGLHPAPTRRRRPRSAFRERLQHPRPRRSTRRPVAVRRQPAEGRAEQVARDTGRES